jgi:hypothetical protein
MSKALNDLHANSTLATVFLFKDLNQTAKPIIMLLSGNLFLNSFYFPHCVLSQLGDFFLRQGHPAKCTFYTVYNRIKTLFYRELTSTNKPFLL